MMNQILVIWNLSEVIKHMVFKFNQSGADFKICTLRGNKNYD